MPLILHLSDLHLGDASRHQTLGDFKTDLVPLHERPNRIEGIGDALEALAQHLSTAGKTLDAIVISGDITIAGDADGLDRLVPLLDRLGPLRPAPGMTVVVPGNHDVAWFTPPSDRARYELFLTKIRSQGFVTPPLDGVDSHLSSSSVLASFGPHVVVGADESWAIVPMNSANYCGSLDQAAGVTEADWRRWTDLLEKAGETDAKKALESVRLRDMPRISPWQFAILKRLLGELTRRHPNLVKIATFHHQLLPVSTDEENKAFESFSNLGLVRSFLHTHGTHILLHGHKHASRVYHDDIDLGTGVSHRIVVVSGGQRWYGDYDTPRSIPTSRLADSRGRCRNRGGLAVSTRCARSPPGGARRFEPSTMEGSLRHRRRGTKPDGGPRCVRA